ncbi:SseB family protein [Streptomyces sp. ACA25]|uniref:SseB family protein n=1 Tax=Streptomyces sp. ACA25 TaxID=3022596 RepID=UPI0023080F15|nr:SseB family protein [Streptomyces sp. ACA25]MDB1086353.1 SseB family protein [Streptomyces sp. ACA25]
MYGYDQSGYAGQYGQHGGQQGQHPGQQPAYGTQPPPVEGYGAQQQPMYAQPQQGSAPPSLTDAVRAYTSGAMSTEEFQDIFCAAKIYCPRGENPGFLALHTTQEPVIPLFTTLKELRRYAGKESRYFTVTGGEVLDLLPTGYGFALDMEGEHRIVLDAKAAEEMVEYTMRRMYG